MIAEFKREELPAEVRVELAIVESGILTDQGKKSQAVVALQIPQLNPKRAFEYSPRLFSAYADALANAGRDQEAERWARLSVVAEAALGQEADLFEKEETPAERPVKAADEEASEKAEATGSEENTSEDSAAEAPEDSEAEEKAEADVE